MLSNVNIYKDKKLQLFRVFLIGQFGSEKVGLGIREEVEELEISCVTRLSWLWSELGEGA